MGRLIVAALLLLVNTALVYADSATTPAYFRLQQGTAPTGAPCSCSGTAAVCAYGNGDRRSICFMNSSTTVAVAMCAQGIATATLPTPTPVACTVATARIYLPPSTGFCTDRSTRDVAYSCITSSGSSTVYVLDER